MLLNEVIFGLHEPLEAFAGLLNEALLMNSVSDLQPLLAVRDALLTDGALLANAGPVLVIEVYALNRR